ncbi:terminase small subunit [Rhizobiales bacterium 3FA27D7]|jgi:phage terminase small subunit|uniref:terminase small subunit n=1 Tax=Mesorhizobium sp. 2RAF21 TaxID=3232995 RepID=UPI0010F98B66
MNLTDKQQRFVAEYLVDLNATQAAIRAGYSEKTARSVGSENLTKPDIADLIRKKQERVAEKAEWTAVDRLAALKRISDAAEKNDARVAVSAIAEANKMQGSHAPTKTEVSGPEGGPIQTESRTWRDVLRSEKS